jgi:hypothetical protein
MVDAIFHVLVKSRIVYVRDRMRVSRLRNKCKEGQKVARVNGKRSKKGTSL